jgi:hypothetical protein
MEGSSSHRLPLLPTEILLEVFGFVNKVDLKSLRLASKKFNAIASSMLFMSVNASPYNQDLEVLRLISEHEDFRHYVREIVYFEVFFHYPEFTWLSEYIDTSHDPTLQPDVHVSFIAAALARMPNLRGLTLKNHWFPPRPNPSYYYTPEEAESGRCYDHKKDALLYGPRTSRGFPVAETYLRPGTNGVKREYVGWRCPAGYDYGFEIMRNALAISNVHLLSLFVDYVANRYNKYPGGLYLNTFLNMSPRDLEYTCNAFRHLRKISLCLAWDYGCIDSGIGEKYGLAKVLAAAHNLEELTLDFCADRWNEIGLKYTLGTSTWPRLRSLCLFNNVVDDEGLADLVFRHHKTLKSLQLWRIYLHGNWWTWAERVQPWISTIERIEFAPEWYRRRETCTALWMVPQCCFRNYLLSGHYQRDCCKTSHEISKQHPTDEGLMRALRASKRIRPDVSADLDDFSQ